MKLTQPACSLRFETRLAEEAVFRVIHSGRVNHLLAARILGSRSQAYELLPGENRDAAFRAHSMRAFVGLGLDTVFVETLGEFPPLSALAELRVLRARSRTEERAELFVRCDDQSRATIRRGVIWLLVNRFLEQEATRHFVRREFFHLSDMVDERFGYHPDAVPRNAAPAMQSLIRDRFRVLWELSILGRLERGGRAPAGSCDTVRPVLDRVFQGFGSAYRDDIFCQVGSDDHPTQAGLIELADQTPAKVDGQWDRGGSQGRGVCPMCRFSTFDWMENPESIAHEGLETIRGMVPAWRPEDGICRRCHELCECRAQDLREHKLRIGASV